MDPAPAPPAPARPPWTHSPRVAGLAFWFCVAGGPIAGVILGAAERDVAWFSCPLCDTRGLCPHRVFGLGLLHLAACVGLATWWTVTRRRLDAQGPAPVAPEWWGLAAGVASLQAIALLLEACVDVETVLVTAPLVATLSAVLVSPRLRLAYRLIGGAGIASALCGFYLVVCLELSPHEAHLPLALTGLVGWLCMVPPLLWILRGAWTRWTAGDWS